ncbi:transcriptional regulator [Actinomadura darangshiensis]|uniref:Transcriptional regulator n=1 Tax=Actinomadura darangshiensis TaxID=705336 RepID=A0A4V2YQD8_9ACTN|nr:transcriptional regulator [Actinomadura darangshiensis]TDD61727.1 transcriptional regulator [Actinomadura darangshiensis]
MTGSDESIVLHVLRCIGHAGLPRVADAAGLAETDAESHLIDLAVAGLVTRTPGNGGAWGLTEAGRAEDARRIVRELDASGARDAVTAAYEKFMVLNPELLDLCSAWQLRTVDGTAAPNDHSDPAYDARVLDRFADLDRRAETVGTDLSAVLPRFGRYRVRLAAALDRARSGALEHLADSTTSYHIVWFQLHEDLLATLGIQRFR